MKGVVPVACNYITVKQKYSLFVFLNVKII